MNAVAQQLHAEGRVLPWTQLWRLLDMPRSTLYYQPRPRKRSAAVDETMAAQIREIIEERPAFGVRRVHVQLTRGRGLVVNCKKVRRIMRLKHWTLRHRPVGRRPRAEKRVSIAERPDERWATDLAYVPCGRDGHAVFAPVIDCCTREVLGWELAPTGRAATAARALEDAQLARFGTLHGAPAGLRLRHDNGLVFGSRQYVSLVRGYGLTQEPEAKPEIANRRLPAGRAQRYSFVESHGGTAPRDSASSECEATLRNLSAAKGNRANISIYGQDQWARQQRPFGLAKRARRVRLRGRQLKQGNATTCRLTIPLAPLVAINLFTGRRLSELNDEARTP